MKEAFEFLRNGGVVMIPIALGSVVAMAIFLERMWSLRRSRIVPSGLIQSVVDLARGGEFTKARDICLTSNSPAGRILQTGLDARDAKRHEIKERFEETGRQEVVRMERFIEAMGTTASVEPLLGLLGTVTGMIGVFKKVVKTADTGAVDPGQLAGGIWQALITTAAGLSVAIIAYVGYRYLQSKSQRRVLEMEEGAMALLDILHPVSAKSEKDDK
ncbi:MAG: MotA/TolQ/ExbB proton channel family protein [Deltaproteobacteria bacterium]|nr:MotA/TolQ/ExbB proton channel family protein [Deltaproteobacteria bacterium]